MDGYYLSCSSRSHEYAFDCYIRTFRGEFASGRSRQQYCQRFDDRSVACDNWIGRASGSSSNNSNLPAAYVPLQVNQVDQSSGSTPGGTAATVTTVSPSFVAQFDPSAPFADQNGLVAAPNVDLASQFVQLLVAKYDFAANAKVIQTYADTTKSLLDITT